MKNKEELRNELEEIAPFLNKMKEKGDGFTVPKNYFHNLQIEVINQLDFERPTNEKIVEKNWWAQFLESFKGKYAPTSIFALASVSVLLIAGFFMFRNSAESNSEIAEVLKEISTEELQDYLFDNLDEIDTDLLVTDNEQLIENIESDSNYEETLEKVLEDLDLDDLEELL